MLGSLRDIFMQNGQAAGHSPNTTLIGGVIGRWANGLLPNFMLLSAELYQGLEVRVIYLIEQAIWEHGINKEILQPNQPNQPNHLIARNGEPNKPIRSD